LGQTVINKISPNTTRAVKDETMDGSNFE